MKKLVTEFSGLGDIYRQVIEKGANTLLIAMLALPISLLVQVFLARTMGPEQFGIFTYIFTWASIVVLPAMLGLTSGSVKFVAAYVATENWQLLKGFLRFNMAVPLFTAVLISIATLLLLDSNIFNGELDPNQRKTWQYALALLVPASALMNIQAFSLRGLKKPMVAELRRILYPIGMMLGLYIVILVKQDGELTSSVVMQLSSVTTILVSVFLFISIRASLPQDVHGVQAKYKIKHWLIVSAPMILVAALSLLLKRTDIIMLGSIHSPELAGIYSIGVRIAEVTLLGQVAVVAIVAPLLSEYYAKSDYKKLQDVARFSAQCNFAVTMLFTVAVLIFVKPIVGIFGSAYAAAIDPLKILLAANLVVSFAGPASQIQMMSNKQNDTAIILIVTVLINVLLNSLLIPQYGMYGAAAATSIALLLSMLITVVMIKRTLNVRALAFYFSKKEHY